MQAAEFREAVHGAMRHHGISMLADYYERVASDGDLDDKRKAVQMMITTLGIEEEKKKDDRAGLPVFNITFNRGGVSVEQLPIITMDDSPVLRPTQAMLERSGINADLVFEGELC